MNWSDIWNPILSLWQWAWNWSLPISGVDIKPIPILIGVFLVEFMLDVCFPSPSDGSNDNGGEE